MFVVSAPQRVSDKLHVPLRNGAKLQGNQEVVQSAVGYKVQQEAGGASLRGETQEGHNGGVRANLKGEAVDVINYEVYKSVSLSLEMFVKTLLRSSTLHSPTLTFPLRWEKNFSLMIFSIFPSNLVTL